MIGKGLAIILASLFVTILAAPSFAQGQGSGGGWGMGTQYQRMYDPSKVETLTGQVLSVDKVKPMKGMNYGIHLMVKTDRETIPVHLGPSWYIEKQGMQIKKGDTVEVKGARATIQDKPAIIAAEVKKEGTVLKLRDEKGVPAWAGWRKRQ